MDTSGSSTPALHERPIRFAGRYEVHEQIGRGAMGVVHAGFDPQLQRRLAIKFVVPRRDSARARDLLLREAQAMAQVSHPNVVSVFDAGETGGRVFIAMDYVAGLTLSQWQQREPRPWREIVAIFVQAGRGLAAAHAAGLVHRDFKPDNVIVDRNGVARVVDFGLVVALQDASEAEPIDEDEQARRAALFEADAESSEGGTLADDTVTRAGAIVGTPAYMAPEQSQGKTADPRSDQYSFCMSLYEMLYGRRPGQRDGTGATPGGTAPEASAARRAAAPAWVLAAIERGLSSDPDARWPSMEALLAALEQDERVSISRAWVLAAVAIVAVVGLGVLAASQFERLRAWASPVSLSLPVTAGQIVAPMAAYTTPQGVAYVASVVANKGRLELEIELPVTGRYYLHGLVWEATLGGARGDADSLFVYVDGGEEKLWHFGCQNETMPDRILGEHWAWQPVLHMANSDSDCEIDSELFWDLDRGPHEIVFRNREDADSPQTAARLAEIVITNQPGWRPESN